jgi:ketosteroid isomerase-like protein
MAEGDLTRAEKMFDAWNDGNVDRMIEFWAEDGAWEDPPEMPDRRVISGREDIEAHLTDLIDLVGGMRVEVEELREVGGEVVAIVTFHVMGAHSGVQFDAPSFHVIRFEEGCVCRYRVFTHRHEAMHAARAS